MDEHVHTTRVTLDWAFLGTISKLDLLDASWLSVERREDQTKAIATVHSVGAPGLSQLA